MFVENVVLIENRMILMIMIECHFVNEYVISNSVMQMAMLFEVQKGYSYLMYIFFHIHGRIIM